MKLVIMIPCLNEEETLPLVLKTIPKKIKGVDEIELLLIDDGCTDKTVEVAKKYGVKQFVHHARNQGLSRSFRDGLNRSLELGADIIVMTEGAEPVQAGTDPRSHTTNPRWQSRCRYIRPDDTDH